MGVGHRQGGFMAQGDEFHPGSDSRATQLLEATSPGANPENRQYICFLATSSHNSVYLCKLRGFVKVKTSIHEAGLLKALIHYHCCLYIWLNPNCGLHKWGAAIKSIFHS